MNSKIILLLFLAAILLFAQDSITGQLPDSTKSGVGLLYGEDHFFAVTAPPGWILDNKSGVSQGLHAVFYPQGGSWEHSPAVMYANGAHKDVDANQTFQQFLTFDSLQFLREQGQIKIVDAGSIKTSKGQFALVRQFLYSQFEAVAYIDEPKIVALIVLTARSKTEFDEAYPAFKKLVESYWFISEQVTFPKN